MLLDWVRFFFMSVGIFTCMLYWCMGIMVYWLFVAQDPDNDEPFTDIPLKWHFYFMIYYAIVGVPGMLSAWIVKAINMF